MLILAAHAFAQPASACRVLDPELQGTYTGGCADGLADGAGEAAGIARYQGEFKAGRKHGRGVKDWPNGDRYEGHFVADRKEGQGSYTWGPGSPWSGEKYTGAYRADRREGYGIYVWPDGDRYAGEWKDDAAMGPPTPRMLARRHAARELLAAVGKPGLEVCRQMRVGSVTLDWIRGTVTAVQGHELAIRIEEPGQFEHRIAGEVAGKGVIVRDAALLWTPCKR